MRWLWYGLAGLLALVLLCVVVLLAMGGGRSESQLAASIEINRPATTVYTWIIEPERQRAWISWLVEIRNVQAGGPGVPGTRDVWVMEDRNNNNQLMEITVDVTRADPPRQLTTTLHSAGAFDGVVDYTLNPLASDRTRLTYAATYHFDHWFAKLLEPVIRRSAQAKLEEDLARLKQRAEAE